MNDVVGYRDRLFYTTAPRQFTLSNIALADGYAPDTNCRGRCTIEFYFRLIFSLR